MGLSWLPCKILSDISRYNLAWGMCRLHGSCSVGLHKISKAITLLNRNHCYNTQEEMLTSKVYWRIRTHLVAFLPLNQPLNFSLLLKGMYHKRLTILRVSSKINIFLLWHSKMSFRIQFYFFFFSILLTRSAP